MALSLSVAVVGAAGVGKSTFIKSIGGPSVEVDLEGPGIFCSVAVNVEEINAFHDEKMGGSVCGACNVGSQCAILMFDVTSRITYKEIPNYYRDVVRSGGDCCMVLVANKVDDGENRKVKARHITFHRKKNLRLVQSSALLGYGVSEALWAGMRPRLARDLLRMGNITFVSWGIISLTH
jgi:GTP-binding nuclear protein Ran